MFLYEPPERERKIKAMEGPPPTRRLDKTVEHLSRGWLPVNPVVLSAVKQRLKDRAFKDNPGALVNELKKDPGLFFYCAKNVKTLAADADTGLDPFEELMRLEDEKLQSLFAVSPHDISIHHIKNSGKLQALRLQQSVISSRTAEALAFKVEIPSGLAYSSAMFRQLGLNLIAWNYPEIYSRALTIQRSKGGNLEQELQKFLGITPLQVAAKFAGDWNMRPEIRHTLSWRPERDATRPESRDRTESSSENFSLQKLCEASELFAQANDPEHYPQAAEQWKHKELQISNSLGADVIVSIKGQVLDSISVFEECSRRKLAPAHFLREKPVLSARKAEAERLFRGNAFAQRCPDGIKNLFYEVYQLIDTAAISVDAIRVLVDCLIPSSGFRRGCLYLLDPRTMALRPSLRMGDLPLMKYRAIGENEDNPISDALYAVAPIKQEWTSITGGSAVVICGALEQTRYSGVLYLEAAADQAEPSSESPMLFFQAIRRALIDCLGNGKTEA